MAAQGRTAFPAARPHKELPTWVLLGGGLWRKEKEFWLVKGPSGHPLRASGRRALVLRHRWSRTLKAGNTYPQAESGGVPPYALEGGSIYRGCKGMGR